MGFVIVDRKYMQSDKWLPMIYIDTFEAAFVMLFLMSSRHSCYLAIVICPTGVTLFRCRDLPLQLLSLLPRTHFSSSYVH